MTATRFWLAATVIALLRLALVADLSLQPVWAPVDDSLYVSRADHLLRGEAFGPYDGWLLAKHLGLSLWIAAVQILRVPYLLSVHVLYLAAGLYFVRVFAGAGLSRALLLGLFTLHAFNPVSFDHVWFRVFREPLAIGLTVLVFASMAAILIAWERGRAAPLALALLAGACALAMLVREEDRLLYGALALFDAVVLWRAWRAGRHAWRRAWRRAAAVIALPLAVSLGAEGALRAFISHHYGRPIVNDLHEGTFPRLIAAMRSVHVGPRDRQVMMPQKALRWLRAAVPSTTRLIDHLPPPGPGSLSCHAFNVCDEWTNGFMIFWVKDAAFTAGLTPDLPTAQAYFGSTAADIRAACERGTLRCRMAGAGLLPPFELRWTPALLWEGVSTLNWMLAPTITLPPVAYDPVPPEYARVFAAVTASGRAGATRWLRPWLASCRWALVKIEIPLIVGLLGAGILVLAIRIARRRGTVSAARIVGLIALAVGAARLGALAYAAVYVGHLHPRFSFSTYAVAVLASGVILVESVMPEPDRTRP